MTMRRVSSVLLVAVVAAMAGCSTGDRFVLDDPQIAELMADDSLARIAPAFLSEPQEPADVPPDEAGSAFLGDPADVRYQGVWEGQQVYLSVYADATVQVVTGGRGDARSWSGGAGTGNTPLSIHDPDTGEALIYLPQGVQDVPDGWAALSDWVIVKVDEPVT